MPTHQCLNCNKKFESTHKKSKFHNLECARQYNKMNNVGWHKQEKNWVGPATIGKLRANNQCM